MQADIFRYWGVPGVAGAGWGPDNRSLMEIGGLFVSDRPPSTAFRLL